MQRSLAALALVVALGAPPLLGVPPLAQLPGVLGCVSETGTAGTCADGRELDGARGVAVSPDGRNVYVASLTSGAVAVFDVDPLTGSLTQKAGLDGCVSESGSGMTCEDGLALVGAAGVAVSPDGISVYVASQVSDAVAVFDRDPVTGALQQKAGIAGCFSEDGTGGQCTNGAALNGATGVAVSSDGRNVYVAAFDSDAVVVFERDVTSGALAQDTCWSEDGTGGDCFKGVALDDASSVAVAPDGRSVYVASQVSDAIARFDRNVNTGALDQPASPDGCVSETGTGGDCIDGDGLDGAFAVAVAPGGRSVYVAARVSEAVVVLDRNASTGALTWAECESELGGACETSVALGDAFAVAVAPDGESVYVAAPLDDAITVFDRNVDDGLLKQKSGLGACVAETGGACADGKALDNAGAVAVSPDGRNVYVAAFLSDAIAVFDRDVPSYDIDGDGQIDPLTDGLLLLRFMFGFTGATLVTGAVDLANCTRCTAGEIEAYITSLSGP
jgi:DNA-binding beta-propeller fold protein YncE